MNENEPTASEPDPNAELEEVAPSIPGMEPGRKIGNFEVKRKLGAGGMGEVWLAYQESMERHIALKLLSPVFVQDDNFVNRFLKEAKLYGKLEHPNIVSAHDAGVDNGVHYMAMSFVDGEDLSAMCRRDRIIPEKDALSYIKKIAEALQYAWDRHKLLHRDIKPSNIMVDKNGVPKLMDMGISKSLSDDSSMTMTGSIVGTPYYISPEQAKADKDIDFRADIYSLGATLYHVATGELPFKAQTTMGVLSKLITETMTPPRVMNPKLSDGCAMLIEIMMSKERDERQASWSEVVEDIDAVLDGGIPKTPVPAACADHYRQGAAQAANPGETAPDGGGTGTTAYVLYAVVAVLVVAAVAAVVVVVKLKRRRAERTAAAEMVAASRSTAGAPASAGASATPSKPRPVAKKAESAEASPSPDPGRIPPPNEAKDPGTALPTESNASTDARISLAAVERATTRPKPPLPVEDPDTVKERRAENLWNFAMDYAAEAVKRGDDFSLAIDKFEKIKKNFAATKYEMLADDEIRRLRDAKSDAVENVLETLRKKAGDHIGREEFEKAAEVFDSYSGIFSDETRKERADETRNCLRAPEKLTALRARLAADLVRSKGDLSKAVPYERKVALRALKRFYPARTEALARAIEELGKADERILESFTGQKGMKTSVELVDATGEYTVSGVEDGKIVLAVDGGETIIVPPRRLSPNEIDRRLDDFSPLSKNVFAGISALSNADFAAARERFAKADILAEDLVEAARVEREAAAERGLMAALKKSGLSPESTAYRDVLRQLSVKKLERDEAERLINDLKVYAETYGDTRFAVDKKPVRDLLISTAEKVFERRESEILFGKDEKPVDNILDAVDRSVNLFAPDEEK